MAILGVSGLINVDGFLRSHFPAQMAAGTRIVQGMDAAAALIDNGAIVAAVAEERFDRVKKSGAFPFSAIDYCLRTAGYSFGDLEAVCGNFNFRRYKTLFRDGVPQAYYRKCLAPSAIQQMLTDRYKAPRSYVPVDHHLAHLHSALASAPFDSALGIVIDAAGEIGSTSVYRVRPDGVRRVARLPIFKSLGIFYSLITQFLGFAFNEDEYKVMGLASLGDPRRYQDFFASAILTKADGGLDIPCLTLKSSFADGLFFDSAMRTIEGGFGFQGSSVPMDQRADVSAALQQRFTEAVFHLCSFYAGAGPSFTKREDNLLLSGGCAENCVTVGALRDSGMFQQIHVAYASGDDGTALGAAAAVSYAAGKPIRFPHQMPFFGPAPQAEPVRALADAHGLRLTAYPVEAAMLTAAAEDVAHDRIVALCNGRMEYGARALGNRSLLALPSRAANKDRINLAIKKRQNYRPFAPAVIAEKAHVYFDLKPNEIYPYMTMLTRVRPEYVDHLPAIVHVDGTSRVQTVDATHNPAFYQFLTSLGALTDVPVVLNTSYNVNHQPIVCTESEAIDTFLEMGIDALFIANFRVSR